MITVLKEITDWGTAKVANGEYHLNDAGHLVGYEGPKTGYKEFSKPMKHFDKRGRKFEEVRNYPEADDECVMRIPFEGSKGNTYYVTAGNMEPTVCTCPGFKFRGTCKHVDDVVANGP